MSERGGMSNESVDIDLNTIGTATEILANTNVGLYEKGFELTDEAKKDLALGKADYSKQCIDVASEVLYAIVSRKRLKQIHELLNKNKNSDYDGDGGFPELLALPTNDGSNLKGIPMVVELDEYTTCAMLKRAIDTITAPLLRNLKQHGEPIFIDHSFIPGGYYGINGAIKESDKVIISIVWENEEENKNE